MAKKFRSFRDRDTDGYVDLEVPTHRRVGRSVCPSALFFDAVRSGCAFEGRAHHGEILEAAARLVEAGKIRPHLDPRRFTLESVGEAYAALTKRTARGKLVVDVGDAA